MRLNDPGTDGAATGDTVAAMDVLVPGIGEIIGGSQREERLDVLDAASKEMNLPAKEYWWYRDLRRYGTVPHAGFGLGFERLDDLRHRHAEHPRCDPVPPRAQAARS
jgi:aspartyl/asparaginyl-tRNA synthetase